MADIEVNDPTDIQDAYNSHMDPVLRSAEQKGSSSYENGENKSLNPNTDSLPDVEQDASQQPGWTVARTLGAESAGGEPWNKRALKMLKKSGPGTAVVGSLVGLGIGASMFFSPSMLLVHIKEVIVSRFNVQSTTLEIRTNKILLKKLTSTATSGCGATSVIQKCKYAKMSNKMLTKLNDAGLVPVDSNGKPLDIKDGWGSDRPAGFTNPDGTLGLTKNEVISAKDFNGYLKENPQAAGLFRKVFNPAWSAFWDSTYMTKFLGGVGGSKASKISGDTEDEIKTSFEEQVDGTEKEKLDITPKASDADTEDGVKAKELNITEADDLLTKAGKQTTDQLADTLSKEIGGKMSGGAMLIANLYCMARETGTIARVVRTIQMGQIVAYGLLFLQAADEIMAGDGSVSKAAFYGTALTSTLVDSSGVLKKKAATDSVAMKYGLLKDKGATSATSDYTKYLPGGGIVGMLQQFANKVSGQGEMKKSLEQFCSAINSDAAQAADLLLNFSPVGLALTVAGWAVGQFSGVLIAPLLGMLAGRIVDSTAQYEDLGNAAATGMIMATAEAGNAGATMPLTVPQASAYLKLNSEVQLANARIDQATLNPFDVTSPNTFMGSIMTQLIPYYGSMQSVSGFFGTIKGIVGSTFSSLLTPSGYAAISSEDVGGCPDTSLSDDGIAAGKLCNVWYGIPVEYLNGIEPDENFEYLVNNGQLNEDGTPVTDSEADKYLKDCATGDGSAAKADCVIDGEDKARYALAFIDRRLQRNMDGEDTVETGTSTETTVTTTAAEWGGFKNGEIPVTAMTNLHELGFTGCEQLSTGMSLPYLAPSAAKSLKSMGDAFAASVGHKLGLISCYRTIKGQEWAWNCFKTKSCNNGNTAAPVGTSNHGLGIALDVDVNSSYDSKEYKWLKAHASEYSWITGTVGGEPWHIKYTGTLP